jgi:multimeric flavodoxin WrbA
MTPENGVAPKRILVVSASPRPDGNSRMLAEAFREGAEASGHIVEIVEANEVMGGGFLRDCRKCRRPDGSCSIPDTFGDFVHNSLIGADGFVYATPLYYYGMAAIMKNFFDRTVCYISASYPRHDEVVEALVGKRSALLMSAEEQFPAANLGVVSQLQEIARYFHQPFVGVVNGVGNKRGEVRYDPEDPLAAARRLGERFFDVHYSDYSIYAERPNAVWPEAREASIDAEVSVYDDA